MKFKIQIRTDIVRNPNINAMEFVLLAKIIQAYYLSGKKNEFELQHKNLRYLLNIGDNQTFKKSYNQLVQNGYLIGEIKTLPRKGNIHVRINEDVIPELTKNVHFTQVTNEVLSKVMIDSIGYVGVRLIYYYQSYINHKQRNKDHCYAALDTIAEHLGITSRSVINYNKKLVENKLIKIVSHDLKDTGEYKKIGNNEMLVFNKYNNHYFVKEDQIEKFVIKKHKEII